MHSRCIFFSFIPTEKMCLTNSGHSLRCSDHLHKYCERDLRKPRAAIVIMCGEVDAEMELSTCFSY